MALTSRLKLCTKHRTFQQPPPNSAAEADAAQFVGPAAKLPWFSQVSHSAMLAREEMEALSEACAARRESYAQLGANAEVLEFFDRFLYNVGLIEELRVRSARS